MMVAAKGFRRIAVDGMGYLWLLRENDHGEMELHVRSKDQRGQELFATFDPEMAIPSQLASSSASSA
jgi:hypothetical protein